MTINSIGSTNQISQTNQIDTQKRPKNMGEMPPPPPMDSAEIGEASKMMNFLSGLDEAGKQEMDDFRDSIIQAAESGETDFSELIDGAPDSLKTFAEENGLNVEDIVNKIAEMKNKPAPNFNPNANLQAYSTTEDDENILMETLFASNIRSEE